MFVSANPFEVWGKDISLRLPCDWFEIIVWHFPCGGLLQGGNQKEILVTIIISHRNLHTHCLAHSHLFYHKRGYSKSALYAFISLISLAHFGSSNLFLVIIAFPLKLWQWLTPVVANHLFIGAVDNFYRSTRIFMRLTKQ